jgi:uncharacterized membrane protein
MEHLTRGFREGLRRELPRWKDERLVTPEAAEALAARYGLARAEAGGPTILAVYLLGALLVGGGIISLVAWNWDAMGRAARLAVILAAMLAAHVAGWTLRGSGRHERVGHGFQILGTLIFGANIALVAQIFHVSGTWYGAFGGFALGALVAGFLLESLPMLVLSAFFGLAVWGVGHAHDHPLPGIAAAYTMAVAYLFLAWRERSRTLLLVAGGGLGAALFAATGEGYSFAQAQLVPVAVGAAFAALPLVARTDDEAKMAGAARTGGRLAFLLFAWLLSFSDAARHARIEHGGSRALLLALAPLALVAGLLLAAGLRREKVDSHARGESMLMVASLPALYAGLSLESGRGAVIVANLAIAFLGLGRVVRGLGSLRRGPFWEGVLVLAILIVSRFFEIEHLLWLKGLAFIACGVAITLAAVAFERKRHAGTEVGHG